MAIERTMQGPKVPTLEGTEVSLSYILWFFVNCIFFNKCLFFSYYMADTFWTDLSVCVFALQTRGVDFDSGIGEKLQGCAINH